MSITPLLRQASMKFFALKHAGRRSKTFYNSSRHRPNGDYHIRLNAIDARKFERKLKWRPAENFETGILKTVQWYLDNMDWVESITSGEYQKWLDTNYGNRGIS
jgi:dTDP-D-glucose 4,6-dehydratase